MVEQFQHGSLDLSISGFVIVESFGSDSIDLVDEYDGGRFLLG